MFGKLENKVAIITGAGQGIGAGIARVFAGAGAKVMVATRTASHGETTVADIEKAGGTAALCAVDIGNLENVERAVSETVDKWGGIDIMVHNAASFLGGPVEGYSEDDLETVLSVNLKACFRLSKAVIPYFKERGGGRLLFTSSVTGPRVVMPGTHQDCGNRAGARQHHRKRG
jgi:3-oxoacyl-[acyl-carrier protein] reductase